MQGVFRWSILALIVTLGVWSVLENRQAVAVAQKKDSQCVKCHTNVKGLIRLGWEIEETKGTPAASEETEGEG